jgi:hypothetical protein
LAQIVSEPIFDIAWLVEAERHQRFDPILRGRSTERTDARIPSGTEFDVRRQAGVNEPPVLPIAHLSNLAIRVASASPDSSRNISSDASL